MQIYKVPRFYIICNFALAGIVSFFPLVMGFISVTKGKTGDQFLNALILSFWVLFWIWGWYRILYKRPLEIRIADEGSLIFCSLLGSIIITAKDIISIKEIHRFSVFPLITFRYIRGSICLMGRPTGFEDLLDRIVAKNPTVELNLSFGP